MVDAGRYRCREAARKAARSARLSAWSGNAARDRRRRQREGLVPLAGQGRAACGGRGPHRAGPRHLPRRGLHGDGARGRRHALGRRQEREALARLLPAAAHARRRPEHDDGQRGHHIGRRAVRRQHRGPRGGHQDVALRGWRVHLLGGDARLLARRPARVVRAAGRHRRHLRGLPLGRPRVRPRVPHAHLGARVARRGRCRRPAAPPPAQGGHQRAPGRPRRLAAPDCLARRGNCCGRDPAPLLGRRSCAD
mmetsp:Transcript_18654/g.59427  ORF Transcript_18654/g.59427 Transcript_18654/m.59427 type:complete len:251 (+) Transcript_18654:267-1019(+)